MKEIKLKITLNGLSPQIWRRIVVPSRITLSEFSDILQIVMGWTNSHLFIIEIGSMKFVHAPDWEEDAKNFQNAELAILDELIPRFISVGECFSYIYDMGDGWIHDILVESFEESGKWTGLARCISGERSCPPENIGGIYGYQEILDFIADPINNNSHELEAEIGDLFDPDNFEMELVNRKLDDYCLLSKIPKTSYWNRDFYFYAGPFIFNSSWPQNLSEENSKYAELLPFRRDVVTFLTYLQNNNVKGTKALGNLPRKHIRDITAGFVDPPILDTYINGHVWKLQNEDEVPELVFMHVFLNTAGLIIGAENLDWVVSNLGEIFLKLEPKYQVWFMACYWSFQFNWETCSFYSDEALLVNYFLFQRRVMSLLLDYPLNIPIDIDQLVQDLDKGIPDWFSDDNFDEKRRYIVDVVIIPFEKLGMFDTIINKPFEFLGYKNYEKVIFTEFGTSLIASLYNYH